MWCWHIPCITSIEKANLVVCTAYQSMRFSFLCSLIMWAMSILEETIWGPRQITYHVVSKCTFLLFLHVTSAKLQACTMVFFCSSLLGATASGMFSHLLATTRKRKHPVRRTKTVPDLNIPSGMLNNREGSVSPTLSEGDNHRSFECLNSMVDYIVVEEAVEQQETVKFSKNNSYWRALLKSVQA